MILLNGSPINITIFPDKTSQVWKLHEKTLTETNYAHVTWIFDHEGEFMHLAQLKSLLQKNNIKTDLHLKYLPYGRQDKSVSNNATFALYTFAELLNHLEFNAITIMDPHSTIALGEIERSSAIYPVDHLNRVIKAVNPETFCYPDHGAVSKYSELAFYKIFRYVYGEKVRDQATGNIISYKLIGNVKGRNVLIVDDICDGGMTFKLLAKDLLVAGATEVNLFVTHGIFSKGLRTLKESGIKRIFTQDGEAEEYQNNITYRKL